jgi:hypothetical protein
MESMENSIIKIASELIYCSLWPIVWVIQNKNQLEDLGLKYTEPSVSMISLAK